MYSQMNLIYEKQSSPLTAIESGRPIPYEKKKKMCPIFKPGASVLLLEHYAKDNFIKKPLLNYQAALKKGDMMWEYAFQFIIKILLNPYESIY